MDPITVESLAYGGDGVAHLPDGRVAFVSGACPEDVVRLDVVEDKSSFVRAEIAELVEASPLRVEPPCPYFGRCGGCQWQHVAYATQLEAKRAAVADALRRIGGLAEAEIRPCSPSKAEYGYRNKIELVCDVEAERLTLGYHRARSNEIVPVDICLLLPPKSQGAPRALQGALRYALGDEMVGMQRVGLRVAAHTRDVEVAVWTDPGPFPRARVNKTLASALRPTSTVRVMSKESGHGRKIAGVETLGGAGYWVERLGEYEYAVSAPSFFQVNSGVTEEMIACALDALEPDGTSTVIDLYAGAGTFTLPIAELASETLAIEVEGSAVRDLRRNIEEAEVDAEVLPGDAARVLAESGVSGVEAVLLDPPRAGLRAEVIERLVALQPSRIAYVSCDPPTLARDVAAFSKTGYRLDWVQPFDVFPQTWHVETVARLSRS